MQTWTIDLSTNRNLRDHFINEGKPDIAKSVDHTESIYEGETIQLVTLEELIEMRKNNPNQFLISIFGEEISCQEIDEDTRMGYVAAGFLL